MKANEMECTQGAQSSKRRTPTSKLNAGMDFCKRCCMNSLGWEWVRDGRTHPAQTCGRESEEVPKGGA